ncbi:GtrA family protein [Paludibacterium yongneupense]|uniref:GtrA family protein n=1 Tax=Paludibacterium yongneupense TaxID=400061 RepID=UPI0004025C23|nr:GtrA family protein [Paludibacterium yongneupense]
MNLLFRQFLRFAAVGASGTLVQYATLWAGVELMHAPAAFSSGIGYILGSIVNYVLNYFFTFKSGASHMHTAAKYYAVLGVGWSINTGLMALLAQRWGVNYWLAQLFTTGIGLIWNFTGSRWWAFRSQTA